MTKSLIICAEEEAWCCNNTSSEQTADFELLYDDLVLPFNLTPSGACSCPRTFKRTHQQLLAVLSESHEGGASFFRRNGSICLEVNVL
jgi:hypothetical protein